MLSFIIFHTRTSFFCSILAYVLFGNHITAQKVFVVTSFYNTLRQTMTVFFPQGITQIAEAHISIKRIQKFLLYKETTIPKLNLVNDTSTDQKGKKNPETDSLLENNENGHEIAKHVLLSGVINIKGGTTKWTDDQSENTLSNVNINFCPGKLTAVIGPVGSGKTSLLHVILKELPLAQGSINVFGTVSYASQEAWLFGGSVRQNILFGEPYNKDRYRHVVKVCALRTDFEQFECGDKTIVGERGVSLSGGQRARINLARAVYKDADIYLLDDPLSAVDSHVGKHLFEDCITGYLKNKTIILVTHQLQYLNNVDNIILLENGTIKAEGTYSELQQTGQDFTKLLAHYEEEEELVRRLSYSRQSSMQSVASSLDESHLQKEPAEIAETRSKGSVSGAVYKGYLFAGGGCFLMTLMLFMCILAQFLAKYASSYFYIAPRDVCIYVFCAITAGTIIITLVRSFMFFSMCMIASTRLHDSMFNSITRATMRFFNTNSSGRILNRFSKDMGSIDELLPAALIDCLQIGLTLVAIIIVVSMMNPWLLLPTGMAGIIFYYLRIFYLSTSRSGLTTIRAFQAESILKQEFDNHQDLHSTAWYLFIASSRAFGYWLDLVCLVYIGLVTLSFLFLDDGNFGGNVGLAITQSVGLTGMFQWGMRQSAELENQMTSVERVLDYTNLESEPPLESPPDKKPRSSWPETGKIVFSQVFLRYSPSESWVLKNLNFTILPLQKVGIVGRTGAGKSSLISTLFRLTEVQGSIIIDDIAISSLGLHELRSKISIIPQEPVLFSGTLRKNLDPFDQYTDDVLWNALEEVELKDVVGELVGGLNAKISEGGTNMSVGQRQQYKKYFIFRTDSLIQNTIRRKFASCTVLTIAHRLNTVMDSDKVLVMDSGSLVVSLIIFGF
ncbi:hypothetical protein AAG570_000733 [Ranatra chinensis]|uniref:Multidrug resistance-associated protein lethal(2)03659 n=1 Tax=Ranatra chinensis TaxID=642074 RepID=A0ABD0YXX1_9HEMI